MYRYNDKNATVTILCSGILIYVIGLVLSLEILLKI
jgi:hypothetical protein